MIVQAKDLHTVTNPRIHTTYHLYPNGAPIRSHRQDGKILVSVLGHTIALAPTDRINLL